PVKAQHPHPIRFGFCLPIFAAPGSRLFRTPNYLRLDAATTLRTGQRAEALGFDDLWVADHLMLGQENAILEGWTTLAALAGCTSRAGLGMIHQAHFFRQPALAAKMMATLDQISGGRFLFFADPAFGKAEHLAYDLPYPDAPAERIARTVEGVELALALWKSGDPVTFDGQFYRVTNATCTPLPAQQPHPPVWFGEDHPDTLAACARLGQGWNSVPVGLAEMRVRLAALAAACAAIRRDFGEITRSYETQILVAPDRASLRRKLQAMADLTPDTPPSADLAAYLSGATDALPESLTRGYLLGTPEEVTAQMQAYVDVGVNHFMLWFMDAPEEDGMELFMQKVAVHFR
ncbi:MAG TPA: LLM class flavin-dependent oxidoreductase, partial [Caldilineaceae bacterium]|nr:LLM class flavin-dependent oxidoreductase [Caldilineaceae bacterium]